MRKILVVTEWPLREGWEQDFLTRSLLREGIHAAQIIWASALTERPYAGNIHATSEAVRTAAAERVAQHLSLGASVVLSCGDFVTRELTGCAGIDKWQSSVLRAKGHTIIPCYPMDRLIKDMSLQVWFALAARKAAAELRAPTEEPKYDFLLNPPLEEALAFLRGPCRSAEHLSLDIETGRGQINTVGFAVSSRQAIAINVLPDRLGAAAHYELWRELRNLVESEQPKILQNFIYEHLFFSRYGIRLRSVTHDTMIAQKFLWPELEMGLDAVGRMYTDMPYWKDDGKSWNNIRDWERHYEYNCKDTAGTFAGYVGQAADLRSRGLDSLYYGYVTKLFPAVAEMCSRGLPVSAAALTKLRGEVSGEYDSVLAALRKEAGAETLNPRSPTQVKGFLKAKGYPLPKKFNPITKTSQESTDEKSLKKLRMKYPADESLNCLLRLGKLGKALSSYLSFTYDGDSRMRFSINCHGTETGRFAGYCDPWDNGVNPQTIPGGSKGINIKSVFWAEPGHVFLQCDLRQAESRFVAYDSADLNLINTLEDPTRDIHSEVAAEIIKAFGLDPHYEKIDPSKWKKRWRQLGKKSGHGANYSMKEPTFIESCIQEMDLVLSTAEANKVLEAYHKLFPGIRRWHENIRREVAQNRFLRTPLGRERYFWGRVGDDMFREAYSYRPQSTIPDITNHMMLYLLGSRKSGKYDFRLLLQCHDSLLLECKPEYVNNIAEDCTHTDNWHPDIRLPGGKLVIPIEVETGACWGELHSWEP